MKRQPFPNFLFKFQEHLKGIKNDPVEKQSIDSNKTPLSRSVLNLIETLQDINSIRMLSTKNKDTKNNLIKE